MNGYLYIALGKKYLDEAIVSAESLLRVDSTANFTLITNAYDLVPPIFKKVILLNTDTDKPFLYKIKALSLSPYERTFFVDTDTYFCDRCTELYSLLDYFDILIAHCNNDYLDVFDQFGKAIHGYYSYNTGVIVYKKTDKTIQFLKDWYEAYFKHFDLYVHDQPPFMESFLKSDVKIYILQSIYNARTPYPLSMIARPVKIIHGRHNDYRRIEKKLNKSANCSRVWFPRFKLVLAYRRTILFKWYMSLNPSLKILVKKIIKPIVMKLGMRDYI